MFRRVAGSTGRRCSVVSGGPAKTPRDHVVQAVDEAIERWDSGRCTRGEFRASILTALGVAGDMVIGSDCAPYRTAPPVKRFDFMKAEILDWATRRVVVPMEDILQLLVEAEEHPC